MCRVNKKKLIAFWMHIEEKYVIIFKRIFIFRKNPDGIKLCWKSDSMNFNMIQYKSKKINCIRNLLLVEFLSCNYEQIVYESLM